jgi:hypothetical protein
MATKKVTEEAKNTKDELVEVFIPIDYGNPEEMTQYVGVNGVAILVPKGEAVKVKPKYAAEIKRMLDEKDRQFKLAEEQRLRNMPNNPGYVNSTN